MNPESNSSSGTAEATVTVATETVPESSHGEALKSTSIIGGSTAIMMLVRMVRTKVLAILLGPAGVGLEGLYDNILNLARIAATLGIGSSGVRQIAAAVATGDQQKVAATVTTLRRITWILGTAGALGLFLLREPIAVLTFGNPDHAFDVGVLSIALLFTAINGGQGALLQGMRRIGDLARMGIIGTVLGAAVSIPIVYVWGQKGIATYMVIAAANMVLMSWYYARKIQVPKVTVPTRQVVAEGRSLLKLGLVLTWTGLLALGTLYLLRVLVRHQEGLAATGQFNAANQLAMVYIGFILQAMGTDFYPRLTGVAHDKEKGNRMVNEQVEVSMLLALPGILATVAFAPWVIRLFYTAEFGVATEILCWQMAGMLMRVACWPLGMLLVARGSTRAFVFTELMAACVYTLFGWLGLKWFHLPGTGMAFLAAYIVYWVIIYSVVRRVTGFRWSGINLQLQALGAVTVALALAAHFLVSHFSIPVVWETLADLVLVVPVGVYCLRILAGLVGPEKIAARLRKFGIRFPIPGWLLPPDKNQK